MRFDQGVIKEIHARTDIASFIGAYVPLRKRGNDLIGLCPFHSEKTPSFHVHPDRGFFKCFGCGVSGDVITFVSKLENVAFPEAVRMLAQRAGIEVEPENPAAARVRGEREKIYEANAVATAYFERMLRGPEGAAARAYCERRGLTAATIEKFHLGFAPDSWDGLAAELRRAGVELDVAAKAGLVKPSQRGGYYDFFRNRLMVPTYAPTGETIAFGGRTLGEDERKYLNTPGTPVYTKGHQLFALNLARRAASADRTLVVVEGYFDCISLHQAGFENTVAALGTAFTDEQARELHKYAENIFLCFDGDTAGNAAAFKAIDVAMRVVEHAGSSVRVVVLAPGEDPDSFVRSRGAGAFAQALREAKPSIEFRLEAEVERLRTGFDAPAAIAAKAERVIREMTPVAEWDRWRVWIAKRLKVNENDLRNSRFLASGANFAPRPGIVGAAASRHVPLGLQPSSFEREVLAIYLEDPALVREYAGRIPAERLRNEVYRRICSRLVENAERLTETADVFSLFAEDPDSAAVLASLGQRDRSSTVRYEDPADRRSHLERVVERLQLEDDERRYQELSRRLDELYMSGQAAPDDLRAELDALVAKLKRR